MTNASMEQLAADNHFERRLPPSPHRSWQLDEPRPYRRLSSRESAELLERLWAEIDGGRD